MPDSPFTPEQEARIVQLIRAALMRPLRVQLEIGALPIQINAETFAEAVWPTIARQLAGDAGAPSHP